MGLVGTAAEEESYRGDSPWGGEAPGTWGCDRLRSRARVYSRVWATALGVAGSAAVLEAMEEVTEEGGSRPWWCRRKGVCSRGEGCWKIMYEILLI